MPQSSERPPDLRALARLFRTESRGLLTDHFRTVARERSALTSDVRTGAAAAQAAFRRLLERDEEFEAQMRPLIARARDALVDLDVDGRAEHLSAVSREVALGLLSGSGIRELGDSLGGVMTLTMAKDTRADVRVPPYNDAWTHAEGGRHQQQQVWANRQSGHFGFALHHRTGRRRGMVRRRR